MPKYTRDEQHEINTGNVMLSQAGMPLMTGEQEAAFIARRRAGPIGGNTYLKARPPNAWTRLDWPAQALLIGGALAYGVYRFGKSRR